MITINELQKEEFPVFFHYLSAHFSENGSNDQPLFLPLSRKQSVLSDEWKEKFTTGLEKKFGEPGWRKLWVARNEENRIAGHVDIRSYPERNTEHRVLLGMGVNRHFRQQGIGKQLVEFILDYCTARPEISWLDLQVLTVNTPATELYRKMHFRELCRTEDMFRIESTSYGYITMTRNVKQEW